MAQAQLENDVETRNKAAIEDRFSAWRAGTGSPYDLLAADATWTIVGRSMASKTYEDREAFMREVIRPFNARMQESLKPTIKEIFAEEDWVIVLFDANGVALDGEPYSNTYAWFLRMTGGNVVQATAFFDSIAFDELWRRVQPVP
jgi:ketosteroid isomerase-like protein